LFPEATKDVEFWGIFRTALELHKSYSGSVEAASYNTVAGALREFINKIFVFLSDERRNRAAKLINETIKRFDRENKDKADRLKKIGEIVQNFSNELRKADIQLDITLTRAALSVSIRVSEDLIEELEDYFDGILEEHGFPLC